MTHNRILHDYFLPLGAVLNWLRLTFLFYQVFLNSANIEMRGGKKTGKACSSQGSQTTTNSRSARRPARSPSSDSHTSLENEQGAEVSFDESILQEFTEDNQELVKTLIVHMKNIIFKAVQKRDQKYRALQQKVDTLTQTVTTLNAEVTKLQEKQSIQDETCEHLLQNKHANVCVLSGT